MGLSLQKLWLNNFGAIISILVREVDEGLNRDVPQAIGNNQLYEHFNLCQW